MADEKFEKIGKKTQIFKKQRKLLNEAQEKTKCLCDHQKNNNPELKLNKDTGRFVCLQCEKDNISLSQDVLNRAKLTESIENLDNAMDIIKLNLRADNPDDRKILNKTAKAQFFLRFLLLPLVDALTKRDRKKNNKNKDRDESGWNKSRTL